MGKSVRIRTEQVTHHYLKAKLLLHVGALIPVAFIYILLLPRLGLFLVQASRETLKRVPFK